MAEGLFHHDPGPPGEAGAGQASTTRPNSDGGISR